VRRDGRGGRALSPLSPSIPFRVRVKGRLWLGCRTIVRNWEDVGYQNVTLWEQNIGTITSPREGVGGKSPLSL